MITKRKKSIAFVFLTCSALFFELCSMENKVPKEYYERTEKILRAIIGLHQHINTSQLPLNIPEGSERFTSILAMCLLGINTCKKDIRPLQKICREIFEASCSDAKKNLIQSYNYYNTALPTLNMQNIFTIPDQSSYNLPPQANISFTIENERKVAVMVIGKISEDLKSSKEDESFKLVLMPVFNNFTEQQHQEDFIERLTFYNTILPGIGIQDMLDFAKIVKRRDF